MAMVAPISTCKRGKIMNEELRWYTIVYLHEWCSITVSVKAKDDDDALVEAKELLRENGYGRLIETRVVNGE